MPQFGQSDPARVLAQSPALLALLNGHWVYRDGSISIDDATWTALTAQQQADAVLWMQSCGLSPSDQAPAAVTERTVAYADLTAQYTAAMTRLDQIIAAATPTNAQVVTAVQDMATIQKRVLRLIKDVLT